MMAKVGKFSTGLGGEPKKAASPYGMSNKGWESREKLQHSMESRQKPRKSSNGAAPDVVKKS